MSAGEVMNSLSDVYFLDSDIMLFTQFVQQPQENGDSQQESQLESPQQKLSNLESLVALNDDVYEIVPVDPLAPCGDYQNQQDISYSYMSDGPQVNEGLAVLEILYNHPIDAPEYIDINDLITPECPSSPMPAVLDVPLRPGEVGEHGVEDDDDVIFVGEYKSDNNPDCENTTSSPSNAPAPRRNPIRKARKNARVLTKDLLYDEDYTILESSSDEDVINETLKKSTRNSSSLTMKDYRKWPVNGLHERPEYNDTTKQLEKFDYTIRQIRSTVALKKQPPKITKKPTKKRKYVARKKASVKTETQEKVPVTELEELVGSTLQDVRRYIVNLQRASTTLGKRVATEKEDTETEGNVEGDCVLDSQSEEKRNVASHRVSDKVLQALELLKTQAVLYQVVNNTHGKDLMKYFDSIK